MTTNQAGQAPALDEDGFREAAARLLPAGAALDPVVGARRIVRATLGDEQWVVRRWRPDNHPVFTRDALAAMHADGVDRVPAPVGPESGAPIVTVRDERYDAQTWLPGRPLNRYGGLLSPDGQSINLPLHQTTPTDAIVVAGVELLARCHLASAQIAARPDAPRGTIGGKLVGVRTRWQHRRPKLGAIAADITEIRRWLRCGTRVIPAGSDLLRADEAAMQDASVVTHGDIWPAHLLVGQGGATLTGIIDWEYARAGSPLIDLAAFATHISGWSAARAELILGAYTGIAPLSPGQRRLLPAVAALDLLDEVGWLLELGFMDDRMEDDRALSFVRAGLKTLLSSLETLTSVLVPEPKPARGGWRPGPRRGARRETSPAPARAPGRSPRPSRPRRRGGG
ncbi:MAG TPA: phosphotransferase [Thermomicrobiales bacterium]|nr:phosphotransferase [Thermomicrobiales bacterium]